MVIACTSCNFDNPQGMRFCGNCGARLAGDIREKPIPPPTIQGLTTDELGIMMGKGLVKRLRSAGLEARGQRRNVTVLFANLAGITPLSEDVDEEDMYESVSQFVRMLSDNVYKYEGIIDKFTGNGLMALFGAPISHENIAERAVRAALDMQSDMVRLNDKLSKSYKMKANARIGIHSGSVVVGGVGTNMMMDYTAIGDTVNLAQRIEEAADPGTILLSESTFRQVRAFFDCDQVSKHSPNGAANKITAYQVAGIKEQPQSLRGIEGLHAPMIGRDQELVRLKQVANRLIETRQGQFVLVTGEAGLGKSRLTAELEATIDTREIRTLHGRSLAYRRTVPYWIIRDVIYSYLNVSPSDPDSQIGHHLSRLVKLVLKEQAERVLPFLENLLSLPYSDPIGADLINHLDPRQLHQLTFLAVHDLLMAEAAERPLLIVLDDLHWADEASLDMIAFLLRSLPETPVFLLAISRTSDLELLKKATQFADEHLGQNFERITLKSLSTNQSDRLLSLLLSIPDLPEKFREQILSRSAGIPFFLEEILRMLIDEGAIQQEAGQWYVTPDVDISSLGVPNTLQELILTRFDRLDSTQKAVIQVASVIGKDFSLPVLYGVLDDMEQDVIRNTVNTLTERDFVLPQFSSLDNKYTFRHILMSDAIYSTILRKERQRLHGCVGDVIEKLFGERLEDQVEVLANHYRWSNKPDSALSYLIVAGQKAERQYLNEQAFRQYSAALEVIPRIDPNPDQICQVHKGMGDALAFKGDYLLAQEHFQLAIESIEELDYQSRVNTRSGLYRRIAKASERQGDYDRALSQLALAQDALDTSNDTHQIEQAKVLNDIGWIHFRRGNFSTAGDLFIQALELVKKAADYHVMASIYNRLGGVFYYLGDWDQAASYLRKSIQIRERIGDVIGLASSSNNLGNLEIEMGLFDDALEDLQRNLALVERLGQVEGVAVAHNNLGWLYTLRGELELAEGALIKALKTAIQIGYSSLIREASKNIGELYLAKGDYVQARQALVEVAPVFEELGANDQLLHVYRLLGEVALGRKEPNKASEWDQKLTEVIDRYHEKSKEPPTLHWGEVLRFRGMLAIANQDWNYAEGYLQESIKVFESLHSQLYLGRSLYQMGRLAAARENFQTAYAHYHKAGGIFQHIGAKVDIRRADNALEELSTPK